MIRNLPPGENEFLTGSLLGIIVVCLLPWLVFARRKLFTTQIPVRQPWDTGITVLLLIAVLVAPLATATYYGWLMVVKPTDAWGGIGPAVGFMVTIVVSHSIGLGLYIAAFFIQLWRDQWKRALNLLAISYHLLAYFLLCKVNG